MSQRIGTVRRPTAAAPAAPPPPRSPGVWRWVGSTRDALVLSQSALRIFGPVVVEVGQAVIGGQIAAAMDAVRDSARRETEARMSAAMSAAVVGVTDAADLASRVGAVQGSRDNHVEPRDLIRQALDAADTPEALDWVCEVLRRCETPDGVRIDLDAEGMIVSVSDLYDGIAQALTASRVPR